MNKKRLLFFHFDLSGGGAEKVLVNLLNGLDKEKYDITLLLIFKQGENLKFLSPYVKVRSVFCKQIRGITTLFKILSPRILHKLFIKEEYDIEIAYSEFSPTRIIAGGESKQTKRIAWVHSQGIKLHKIYRSKAEMQACYHQYDRMVFVSEEAKRTFSRLMKKDGLPYSVLPNVLETSLIKRSAAEDIPNITNNGIVNICTVGKITKSKGASRLAAIMCRLYEQGIRNWHLYYLGKGEEREIIQEMFTHCGAEKYVTFLGYQTNPYKYIARMSLFVCPSFSEGYSTATIEALILHIPVLVTDCGGMREITAEGQYGLLVENTNTALEEGVRKLLTNLPLLQKYKNLAAERSVIFSPQRILQTTEKLLDNL